MQDFVHLHVHTQYSLLDGQASVSRLVDKAMKDGMKGIAVTDHGNMFGIKEFFNKVSKKNSKPLGIIKDSEKELKPLLAKDAPTDEEQQRITELQKQIAEAPEESGRFGDWGGVKPDKAAGTAGGASSLAAPSLPSAGS